MWEIPRPHFQMGWAGTGQGWKTGIVGNRRATSAPLPRPAHWACKGMRTRGPHRRIYRLPNRATVVAVVGGVYGDDCGLAAKRDNFDDRDDRMLVKTMPAFGPLQLSKVRRLMFAVSRLLPVTIGRPYLSSLAVCRLSTLSRSENRSAAMRYVVAIAHNEAHARCQRQPLNCLSACCRPLVAVQALLAALHRDRESRLSRRDRLAVTPSAPSPLIERISSNGQQPAVRTCCRLVKFSPGDPYAHRKNHTAQIQAVPRRAN